MRRLLKCLIARIPSSDELFYDILALVLFFLRHVNDPNISCCLQTQAGKASFVEREESNTTTTTTKRIAIILNHQ